MKNNIYILTILLIQSFGIAHGQNTVKLFNATGNTEIVPELYYYNETVDDFETTFYSSNSLIPSYKIMVNPFFRYIVSFDRKEDHLTNNLSELLTHKDSVQIHETIADSISPVLILLFLEEELEAKGIASHSSKRKQPVNYYVEISSCQYHYDVNSLRVKKNKYTGNYRVEYVVKWKERGMKKTVPLESETREHIAYEWERKHRTDMKEIPNLSVSIIELCRKIAKEKAEQIAAALKKEN